MPIYSCTYICPVRFTSIDDNEINEYHKYWQFLENLGCEVVVVDGSPPEVFEALKKKCTSCRLIRVNKSYGFLNGKVNAVYTGVSAGSCEKIILADDDIRFTASDIDRMKRELKFYDLIKPQNYFDPNPLWTQVDSARMLMNRSLFSEGDFPGCFGFLKSAFQSAGFFDGDVLFDNEELVKHFANRNMRVLYARDFFILRRPPTPAKWLEQRPRQAYEDFVMKKRSLFFFSMIPLQVLLAVLQRRKFGGLLLLGVSSVAVALALLGRRGGAGKQSSVASAFFAPLWLLERSISIYVALYWRLARGGYPFGDVIIKKGTGKAWLEPEVTPRTK